MPTDQELLAIMRGSPPGSQEVADPAATAPPVAPSGPSDDELLKIMRGQQVPSAVIDERMDEAVRMQHAQNDPLASSRSQAAMVGGMAGGFLGAPAGPVGAIVGGGLGAAAGAFSPEVALQLGGLVLGMNDAPEGLPLPQRTKEAAEYAIGDMMFGVGAAGLTRGMEGLRMVGRFLSGTGKAQVEFARRASDQFGVSMDMVSSGTRGHAIQDVLGVLPFISKGFSRGAARRADDIAKALTNEVTTIGPIASIDDLSDAAIKGARETYGAYKQQVNALYDEARRIGREADVVIEPKNLRAIIQSQMDAARAALPAGASVDPDLLKLHSEMASIAQNPQKYVQLVDGVIKKLNTKIGTAVRTGDNETVRLLVQMKEAAKQDIWQGAGQAPEFAAALDRANKFNAEMKSFFNTVTAKKFKAVDPDIFRTGASNRAPSKRADQLFDTVLQNSSPQGMKELRALVGDETFNGMVATRVKNAADAAIDAKGNFDPARMSQILGYNVKDGGRTMDAALKEAGYSPARFREFQQVMTQMLEGGPDVSKFLARRLILGGGLTGAAALTGGHSIVPSLAAMYVGRKFGFMMNNPKALSLAKRSLKGRGQQVAAAKAASQLIHEYMTNGDPASDEWSFLERARDELSLMASGRGGVVPIR